MIHLDAYEMDGETFIRTWDTEGEWPPRGSNEHVEELNRQIKYQALSITGEIKAIEPPKHSFLAGFWPKRFK